MSKKTKIIKISNEVSDFELVRIIEEYEEKGYSVVVDAKKRGFGYVELIIKKK